MVYFIVGKTNAGKTTVASAISQTLNIPEVVSYATRPMRPGEVNGREHIFISNEEAEELLKDQSNVIAQTEINGSKYFTLESQFKPDQDYIYVIDPNGIDWMKENKKQFLEEQGYHIIFMDIDEKTSEQRSEVRGDDKETFLKRIADERQQMNKFLKENKDKDDVTVIDSARNLYEVQKQIYEDVLLGKLHELSLNGEDPIHYDFRNYEPEIFEGKDKLTVEEIVAITIDRGFKYFARDNKDLNGDSYENLKSIIDFEAINAGDNTDSKVAAVSVYSNYLVDCLRERDQERELKNQENALFKESLGDIKYNMLTNEKAEYTTNLDDDTSFTYTISNTKNGFVKVKVQHYVNDDMINANETAMNLSDFMKLNRNRFNEMLETLRIELDREEQSIEDDKEAEELAKLSYDNEYDDFTESVPSESEYEYEEMGA